MEDMYMEGWVSGEDLGESAEYVGLRAVVAPQYRSLPIEYLESTIGARLASMSPEDAESFWSALGNIGKKIAPVAAKILPAAAPIVGTAFGGPVGAMVGGMAGKYVAGALGGAGRRRPSPAAAADPTSMPMRPSDPAELPSTAGNGTPAAAQLLSLLQNPQLLQSLLGQVLGPAGASTVPVGAEGTPAAFGSFMNALSVLANQAASEAESAEDDESLPEYLFDRRGQLRCDPAVPEERAELLLQQLRESMLYESVIESDPGMWLVTSLRS